MTKENKLRFETGIILIVLSIIIHRISWLVPTIDFTRLLICIAFTFLGLGIRACVIPFSKKAIAAGGLQLRYIYYVVVLIIISCIIYLSFYQTIQNLSAGFFYFISFLLFVSMGGAVVTAIERFS